MVGYTINVSCPLYHGMTQYASLYLLLKREIRGAREGCRSYRKHCVIAFTLQRWDQVKVLICCCMAETATDPSGCNERRSPMSSSCRAILSRSRASLARSLSSDACISACSCALALSPSSRASLSSSSLANLHSSKRSGVW